MGPGPVFLAEMRSSSRRPGPFALRSLYAGSLLGAVWLAYLGHWRDDRPIPPEEFARLARGVYGTIAASQGALILAIAPALVGGSIAGDRARGTLDHLLATRLTSAEIVLGRVVPRLARALGLLALGLPVLVLLCLLGGIDPLGEVLPAEAAAAGGAVAVAGLAAFASAVAREPREAAFAAYGLMALWLGLPTLLDSPLLSGWTAIRERLGPAIDALAWTNPLARTGVGPGRSLRVAGLLAAVGAAFTIAAIVALRPASRHPGTGARPRRLLARRRPGCGDDPMGWKERHAPASPGFAGLAARAVLALLVLAFAAEAVRLALAVWEGSGRAAWDPAPRAALNGFLRVACTSLYTLALLAVAISAAGSISAERERGTWDGVAASPLEGPEVLSAKRAGAYRRARPLLAAFAGLLALGLGAGAIHPLALPILAVELPAYLAFAAALGVAASLHGRWSAGEVAGTIGFLVFVQGGYLFCCVAMWPGSRAAAFGCTPFLVASALLSSEDVARWQAAGGGLLGGGGTGLAAVLSVVAYALGAMGLNAMAETTFDAALDRPRRERAGRDRG